MRVGAGQVRLEYIINTVPPYEEILVSLPMFMLIGTKYGGIYFRRALLDTIQEIGQ